MSKTPKEIWCQSGLYWDYKDDWSEGSWTTKDYGGVKYVRAPAAATQESIDRAIELLERIAGHDHQGAATRVLLNAPSGTEERLAAYANSLREVARTDIQGWAQLALLHLRGEDND